MTAPTKRTRRRDLPPAARPSRIPGPLLHRIAEIRFAGVKNLPAVLRYTRQRDRLDAKHVPAAATTSAPPGQRTGHQEQPDGVRVDFADGRLDVAFLRPDLLRLDWGPRPAPPSFAVVEDVQWPGDDVVVKDDGGDVVLTGTRLTVRVDPQGAVTVVDADGRVRRQESPPQRRGEGWTLAASLAPEAAVYGLGERMRGLDLRPGTYSLWNTDAGGHYDRGRDPLYINVPAYVVLDRAGASLVFHDNPSLGEVELGEGVELRLETGALRSYVAVGTPASVLEAYTALTGRPNLPPKWALGYHATRWWRNYNEKRPRRAGQLAADAREVVEGFAARGLPLSVLHLDGNHMDRYKPFTVDERQYPDLPGMIREFDERYGVKMVTLHEGAVLVDDDSAVYRSGEEHDVWLKNAEGDTQVAPVWLGDSVWPDFTDARVRAWWGEHYKALMDTGFVGVWHDMNEPSAFVASGEISLPRSTRHSLEGFGGDGRQGHNLWGLLNDRAGYEAQRKHRPERRPWILSRSGWAGLQRWAWCWTGDVASSWGVVRGTVGQVVGLGLSGIPYSGPDIGGFSGAPSEELYTRWFQLGSFLPFFRTHSAFYLPRREPWHFGEQVQEVVRRQLALRYALLPYWYSLAEEAHRTGAPLVRPLWWDTPDDADLWRVEDAFLLGDALLVAPVVDEGARSRTVRLPAGDWVDWHDGTPHAGGLTVHLDAPLDRLPLLARAGAVVPTEEDGVLVLHVVPPTAGSAVGGRLFSDDGDGWAPGRTDTWTWDGDLLRWSSDDVRPLPYERVVVRVHGAVAALEVDGAARPASGGDVDTGVFRTLRLIG